MNEQTMTNKLTADDIQRWAFSANSDREVATRLIRGFFAFSGLKGAEPLAEAFFANRVDDATRSMAEKIADYLNQFEPYEYQSRWRQYLSIACV